MMEDEGDELSQSDFLDSNQDDQLEMVDENG